MITENHDTEKRAGVKPRRFFRFQTGIGATTWDDTNIHVTISALSTAPR